jgi:serine/threonine protein kinase
VVLYEALTGRRPFESETAFNIMMDHVDTPPVPPSDLNPAIPRVLNDIVLKAMAKRPEDRFQSAGEFHTALEVALRLLDAKLTPQRVRKSSVWHSLAQDCVRLAGRRTVQVGLVAVGLAFLVTAVSINVVGYGATTAMPDVRWAAPPVPAGALQLSRVTPNASMVTPTNPPTRETVILRKSVAKPAAVSLNADRSAPESLSAPAPLGEPTPPATDAVETIRVAEAVDTQPQGESQRKNSVKRFFGKVFHRKAKLTAGTNEAGEQAAQGAELSR